MNTRNMISLSLLCIYTIFIVSCKKDKEGAVEIEKKSSKTDIYIMGMNTNGAVFWKNDSLNECSGCALGLIQDWRASGIVANNGDIYIPRKNGYLKNGVQITLPYAREVSDIAVSGNGENVYAIGWSDSLNFGTFYWKNDKLIKLSGPRFSYPPLFVTASGNDFYMTGRTPDSSGYWKNDTFIPLFYKGSITGITVNGTDVYVTGSDTRNNRGYWKNGVFQQLRDKDGQLSNAIITDIYFDKDDVYAVGDGLSSSPPIYWKNNQPIGEKSSTLFSPRSITINNNDIYVVCNTNAPGYSTDILLWKNGIMDTFAKDAIANKILIVK